MIIIRLNLEMQLTIKKLYFLLHSLLDNGAKMTRKRRSVFLLIFMVNNYDHISYFYISCPTPGFGCRKTID